MKKVNIEDLKVIVGGKGGVSGGGSGRRPGNRK